MKADSSVISPRDAVAAAEGTGDAGQAAGFAFALGGAFLFALVLALPKIGGTGLGVVQIAFFRFGFAFLTLLPLLALARSRAAVRFTPARLLHSLRSLFAIVSLASGVYAAQHMLLADAMVLGNLKAVFVVVLAALFLREALTGRRALAVGLALLGAMAVVQPSGPSLAGLLAEPAAAVALLGAFAMAVEAVLLRRLSTSDGTLPALVYFNGTAALVLLAVMPFVWEAPRPLDWLLLAAMGPLALLGNFCNVLAYRRVEATRLVPYAYSMMLFSALIGWLVLAERPGPATLLGGLLIALAGWLVARERRKPH